MATAPGTVSAAVPAGASHTWEDVGGESLWENAVVEDEQGRIVVAAGDTLAQAIRKRRKRLEQNDYAQRNRRVVRDMIRYLYVIVDASRWMRQKDPILPPGTRMDVTVQLLLDFVQEFYDQNPLSHLGFVLVKHGEAEILSQLSGNSKTHKMALRAVAQLAAQEGPHGGEFSLQNGLEVAGRSLGHQPRHGSREIVIVTSALSTCDPGSILTETLPRLQRARIRVSTFALAAELHICRKLAEETHGSLGVCLDKAHFRDWMLGQCVPPPALKQDGETGDDAAAGTACAEMIPMGFPTRTSSEVPSLVHASADKTILARTAFTCPQCQAKNAELPTDCAVCGLKLVLAPHLARSFHHLFPVAPFVERPVVLNSTAPKDKVQAPVSSSMPPATTSSIGTGMFSHISDISPELLVTSEDDDRFCFACLSPLGSSLLDADTEGNYKRIEGELLRFQCPDCNQYFCVDCDAYLHETLHNCPGCLRKF